MPAEARRFFAPAAWVDGSWARDVVLTVGTDGHWSEIAADAPLQARAGAQSLAGPILPGLVNAHGHAFQRAIAGLTERTEGGDDDFWRWRDRMYRVAHRVAPGQLESIAAFVYGELLRAGYTQICEFHYLHNDVDGRAYASASEMASALVRAAHRVGVGLTLLPALYMRSGFGANGLREDQRRFACTPASILRIVQDVSRQCGDASLVTLGIALHSLRAVDEGAMHEVVAGVPNAMPIHIHVAEQQREVDDCVERHGLRPVEWLLDKMPLDSRWNLVHATHCTHAELQGLRNTGASIVLCPSTEANLGDGIFELRDWMRQGGSWAIGSDSHVTRDWCEELRLLEYSQRLSLRQRNVAARAGHHESSASALFQGALAGGSAAAGVSLRGLAPGQRADFMMLDVSACALAGIPPDHLLDALIFSSPAALPAQVFVAGNAVREPDPSMRASFVRAMGELWS
jgi:formimidoylglutamate deiminase